ncbi:MAG: hypothetical protein J5778_09105 [Clostridiales bacterium]|nr:hypothetical protein [Clostridiales bacterium]
MDSPLAIAKYKNGKKEAVFYDDRMEFDGNVLRYDDIEEVTVNASNSKVFGIVFYLSNFAFDFAFKDKAGQTYHVERRGTSLYGIGSATRVLHEYDEVAPPMYDIVIASVTRRLIRTIEEGGEVTLCDMKITRDNISFRRLGEDVVIDSTNYEGVKVAGDPSYVLLYMKDAKGKTVQANRIDPAKPNAGLIVPVIRHFFG